jgi:hypothetical protein
MPEPTPRERTDPTPGNGGPVKAIASCGSALARRREQGRPTAFLSSQPRCLRGRRPPWRSIQCRTMASEPALQQRGCRRARMAEGGGREGWDRGGPARPRRRAGGEAAGPSPCAGEEGGEGGSDCTGEEGWRERGSGRRNQRTGEEEGVVHCVSA